MESLKQQFDLALENLGNNDGTYFELVKELFSQKEIEHLNNFVESMKNQ
jgi:hypothetical protein